MAYYKVQPRSRRHRRVRARVAGTPERPRLAVFRSLKHIRAQLIDDVAQKTLAAVTDTVIVVKAKTTPCETAHAVGKLVAERARALGLTRVVFDRGGYAYHGRVQALADGAREGGLEF
ncbi:MAG: 50S ribosomal protein L18 [Candidatus Veblenbacteria bacterium]|nr:50S ribosomal protein L18 [Candidatus Veblenbacteria bacterium]MDZ4229667.1 50S ribosomal protein L18 [Candidatus Veblenbacteria bacterium]